MREASLVPLLGLMCVAWSLPHRTTRFTSSEEIEIRQTKAANPAIRDSIKVVTNQLLDPTNITLDVRTPPKVKQQTRDKEALANRNKEEVGGHAGIAVPIDSAEELLLLTTTKSSIIHQNNKKTTPTTKSSDKIQSTTDSGLSTWILLSAQPTTDNSKIPENNRTSNNDKKTVPVTPNHRYVNKIKASLLTSTRAKLNKTENATEKPSSSTTKRSSTETSASTEISTSEHYESSSEMSSTETSESKEGGLDLSNESKESKDSTTKKPGGTRRPSNQNKRKKNTNKNRRRRPSSTTDKTTPGTNSTKIAQKQKPISTQIYNYLSREVMPTVGVGLVGLIMTAGLASYFLYPFGAVRRSYDIAPNRRKDDKYYGVDEYGGGETEEEMINKVIAGMQLPSDYGSSNSKGTTEGGGYYRGVEQPGVRYRHSSASYYLTPGAGYNQRNDASQIQPQTNGFRPMESYGTEDEHNRQQAGSYREEPQQSQIHEVVAERQKETGYTVAEVGEVEGNEQKFVVGNVPKELSVTPAVVPEHGPRKKRNSEAYTETVVPLLKKKSLEDNEIGIDDDNEIKNSKIETTSAAIDTTNKTIETTTEHYKETTDNKIVKPNANLKSETVTKKPSQQNTNEFSLVSFFRNLLEFKMRIGMDFMQRSSETLSRYLRGVQSRMEQALKEMRDAEEKRKRKERKPVGTEKMNVTKTS